MVKVKRGFETQKRGLGMWKMVAKVVSLENKVRTLKHDNIVRYKLQNLRGINEKCLLSQK
jgi:hypothetical protein